MERMPYSHGYDVLTAEKLREASEDVGMYAGGLSLALMGVNPNTLDTPRHVVGWQAAVEAAYEAPDLHELEELNRVESLKRLSQLSLNGSVERFNKYDLAA